MSMKVPVNAKKSSLHAVVTRANGKKENLGLVSYYHKNPLFHYPINWWINFKVLLRSMN